MKYKNYFMKFIFRYNTAMKNSERLIIIYTIIILLSVMYATQPLQPLLAKEFNITMVQASQFTAVIMLFLAIAPIIYGYVLEQVNAKRVLMSASIILCVTNILLSFSSSYELFLILRTIEAMVVPAILTACMSILASLNSREVKLNMSIYVASTVFGGLIGRVFSGAIATEFGWRIVFISLSFALLLGIFFIQRLNIKTDTNLVKPQMGDVLAILKDRRFVVIYSLMFTVFFVFAGLLNILPFRLKEVYPDVTELEIGLLYLGYGMGIIVSLMIHKIIQLFDKEMRTIIFGMIIFTISTLGFFTKNPWYLFVLVFVFCLGMFIMHTVSTRIANSLKQKQKSLTSGMYLSFYYIGGAVGSIIPPMIYKSFGWEITLFVFVAMLISIGWFVHMNRREFKAYS